MAETKEAIQDAAKRNAELLQTLSETDYAPTALDQQTRYIADIENEIKQTAQKIKQTTTTRQKELRDHEKYQQSVMKKFAYRVSGKSEKFNEKATKEERAYFEALEEEHKALRLKESLELKLQEAKDGKTQLEPIAHKHADAQRELDELYNRIFSGPTPAFPEEDTAEEAVEKSQSVYRDLQARLDAESQVVKIFRQAQAVMAGVVNNLADAHSASTYDLFGGGLMADMMERSALGKAETGVVQLKSLINEAARTSPFVQEIGSMQVASGNMFSDIFFDNIFTDLNFHEKIKSSENEMKVAQKKLQSQDTEAKKRVADLKNELSRATTELENARNELQRVRTEAFNCVAPQ